MHVKNRLFLFGSGWPCGALEVAGPRRIRVIHYDADGVVILRGDGYRRCRTSVSACIAELAFNSRMGLIQNPDRCRTVWRRLHRNREIESTQILLQV